MCQALEEIMKDTLEARRVEGIQLGMQQGMQQGIQQGMQQGMPQGVFISVLRHQEVHVSHRTPAGSG